MSTFGVHSVLGVSPSDPQVVSKPFSIPILEHQDSEELPTPAQYISGDLGGVAVEGRRLCYVDKDVA
uniref:Uncharacterized protein n=1 Tax=Sphaerodactylus townsendi TaxID=933632 RepID=A0ACB8F7V7_9SAUR